MKIKKCIILLLIMIIISGINYTVRSANGDSYNVKMNADKTTLKTGDTITISLKLDNIKIESGEKGLGSYEGSIEYDKNIFEDLKMTGNNEWETPFQNEGRFTATRTDGKCISETQEIAKITLKVKDKAKEGDTKIQIKNFSASNAIENISTTDASLTVKIEKENNNDIGNTNNTSNTTNNNANTNNGNKTGNSTSNQTKNIISNTNAKGTIPKTGVSTPIVIFILISVISCIYGYIRYKNIY